MLKKNVFQAKSQKTTLLQCFINVYLKKPQESYHFLYFVKMCRYRLKFCGVFFVVDWWTLTHFGYRYNIESFKNLQN